MGARRVHASARSLLWPRRVIIEKYYQRLTLDFDTNKRICEEVAIIQSKRLRNKIAGFTTVSCDGRSRDAYGAAAGRSSDVWGASGSVEWQHSRAAVAGVAGSMRGGGSWN